MQALHRSRVVGRPGCPPLSHTRSFLLDEFSMQLQPSDLLPPPLPWLPKPREQYAPHGAGSVSPAGAEAKVILEAIYCQGLVYHHHPLPRSLRAVLKTRRK